MNNFIKEKNGRGFTMVETLVAVAILMISIAGPLTIAQKGLLAAIYARDQVAASFLAQDAMEFVKNYKDNNVNDSLNLSGWLRDLSPGCDAAVGNNKCSVNTIPNVTNSIGTCGSDCPMLYLSDKGYGTDSSSGKATHFNRSFQIKNVAVDGDQATVIVRVEWLNGTVANQVVLEDQIFNIIR